MPLCRSPSADGWAAPRRGSPLATHPAMASGGPAPLLARAQSVLQCAPGAQWLGRPQRASSAGPRRRRESCVDLHAMGDAHVEQARREAEDNAGVDEATCAVSGAAPVVVLRARAHTSPVVAASTRPSSEARRQAPFKALASGTFGGEYLVGRYLGRGASASVWEGTHNDLHLCVAMKVFDQGSRDRKQAAREMKVLSRVRHPRVLEVYEVIESSMYSQLISELLDGESLRHYAQRFPGQKLQENLARRFYQQVVEGVTYCHEKLVAHRDLKLENLLLDSSHENVKIIDFGFAAQVTSKDAMLRAFCGTPSYMAPEIIRGDCYSGFATDVWALGVIVFALLAGALPFAGRTDLQLYAKIRRGIFSIPNLLGEPPRRLIRSLLKMDASTRPPAMAVLRNVWIAGGQDCGVGGVCDASAASPASARPPPPVASPLAPEAAATAQGAASATQALQAHGAAAAPTMNPRSGASMTYTARRAEALRAFSAGSTGGSGGYSLRSPQGETAPSLAEVARGVRRGKALVRPTAHGGS